MKKPEDTSLHELGADARVARIFRWSAIAAAVLTLIVALGLLAWWWLSRDTPAATDEIAMLPPEPLMERARVLPLSDMGSSPTLQSAGQPPQSIGVARPRS
ncbi:hypothetical protein [Thioalkalivibrio sp.]|uniref:hypothetical protein n=1 Tax=Thioalkalivibrio sp. TaxID=2093813 RepID=UPI0012D6ADE6|nr:hypothetical protein [Thioalkalivibrio sp.]TVP81142.1 MAG: hypothetical protein EA346_06035 [Thioalkalivibrio sp.]